MSGFDRFVLLCALGSAAAGCHRAPAPPPAPPPPAASASSASTSFSIAVTYREAANVFEILDNVSMWWSGKCEVEYRDDWKERFGITAEDEQRFKAYKQVRKRHYPKPPEESDGEREPSLFGPAKPSDRFAETFYGAATVDEALTKLATWMPAEDVTFLRTFYAAYRPSYQALLAESAPYEEMATALQRRLDAAKVGAYAGELARWYGAERLPAFTVLYVWWPPAEHIAANNRDRFLLLKYNPTQHRAQAQRDLDLPVHELTHYVSAHQPEAQKKALAKAFLAGCDIPAHLSPVKLLEEPMAVVHQKLFLSVAEPTRFELTSAWYGDRWVSAFAKAIYPRVKEAHASGRPLDAELMSAMARSCATAASDANAAH